MTMLLRLGNSGSETDPSGPSQSMDMESFVVTVASKYRYTELFVLRKEVTAGGTTHAEEGGACVVTR